MEAALPVAKERGTDSLLIPSLSLQVWWWTEDHGGGVSHPPQINPQKGPVHRPTCSSVLMFTESILHHALGGNGLPLHLQGQ